MVATKTTSRTKRVPLGTRNVLTAPPKKGFKRRFVNDVEGRIKAFEDAGYTVVKDQVQVGDVKIGSATQVGNVVRTPVGGGQKAVLMEIKEEYYNEDQAAKQGKIKEAENEMKRNLNSGGQGTYGSVEIQ